MIDVIEFCKSSDFLSGGAKEREKSFAFPPKRAWTRRVTGVGEYLQAVTRDAAKETQETPWHILEDRYINELVGLAGKVRSLGCGLVLEELNGKQSALSNLLATDKWTRPLAEEIARVARIDADRLLAESLGEAPYSHLRAVLLMQELFPQVVFPFVAVLVDAYQEGLMPYGVFNMRLDPNYGGPDVLLCIDPVNLEPGS